MQKILQIKEFEVLVIKAKNSKTTKLSICPESHKVQLRSPWRMPYSLAQKILEKNYNKILTLQRNLEQKIDNINFYQEYSSDMLSIAFQSIDSPTHITQPAPNKIDLYYNPVLSKMQNIQQIRPQLLTKIKQVCMHKIKEEFLFVLSQIQPFEKNKVNNIRIKNIKTRWGSCSSKGNINLSIKLALLPNHLRKYVMLHEIAHLQQPNHGPLFWQHLSNLCQENAKILDRQLKNYHTDLFFLL